MGEASLLFRIGADIKDFNKAMSQIERSLKKTLGPEAIGLSQGLLAGFAGLGAGLLAVGGASVKMAADMEQSKIAFTTMLGDAQKAETFLQQLSDFAAATPFELPGLIEASKKMLAFGFTAQQVKPLLTAVGDAVAGLGGGTAEIDRVTLALGQMQAKGKVSAEEMNQLAELGIPAWKMIADQLGITIPEAMKKAQAGSISAAQAIPALVEGMSKKFGGMMEKQSTSLAGLWSTARDNIGASMRVLGDSIVATFDLKKKLAGANQWLTDFAKALKDGGISGALSKMIPANLHATIIMVAGALAGAMAPALGLVAINAAKALIPLLPWIVAGAALAGIIYLIAKNWDNWGVRLAAVLAVIGTAVVVFTNVTLALKAWAAMTKIVTALQVIWNAVITANPIGLLIVGIGLLIAAGVAVYKNWDWVKTQGLNAWGMLKIGIIYAIKGILKYMTWWLELIPGIGDKVKALQQRLTDMVDDEKDAINQRSAATEADAQTAADAEEQKGLATWKRTTDQKRMNEEAGAAEVAVWDQTVVAAGDAEQTKKDYLDEFSDHFSRTQDELLTEFNRAQDDQTEAFKRGQQDKLTEFEAAQERELNTYKQKQQNKVDAFKQAQAGELEGFKRGLEDQKNAFESALDDEKQTFERHQEDLLNAFKQRQADEITAIQGRQEAERRALDDEYRARMDALDAEQKGIERAAQEAERAKQAAAAQAKVDQAKKDVGRATALDDPELLAQAQKRLAEAQAAQADLLGKQRQEEQKNRIADEKDVLKSEYEQRKQGLKDSQDAELTAAKNRQAAALVQYQRELDDEKIAFGRRQEERKLAFGRMQEDELAAYKLRQEEALKAYQLGLDAELAAFKTRQDEAKLAFQRRQEDELTAWKRAQEDRATRYNQELDDLKTSFKEKLAEQRAFAAEWNRMVDKMKSMQPDTPAVPSSGSTAPSSSPTAPDSSAPSNSAPPGGGGGSGRTNYLAAGGLLNRPTFVAGEAGTEVVAPLAELWKQLREFGAAIGTSMAGLVLPAIASLSTAMPRVTMAAPGGSDAPIILQATLQNILDGELIGEYIFEKKFGPLRQQKRAFGIG